MTDEETVEPQEVMTEVLQQAEADVQETVEAAPEPVEETRVPLAALQKERKKRQEIEQEKQRVELENQWLRDKHRAVEQPVEEDETLQEAATRAEVNEGLSKSKDEILRSVEESIWIKSNPEKYEQVTDLLPKFLKQRPNLVHAINASTNRYEEAYTLMEALTPKQQAQIKAQAPKRDAPGSPSAVPKGAALNQAVDVMSMSDDEYRKWRQSVKKRR